MQSGGPGGLAAASSAVRSGAIGPRPLASAATPSECLRVSYFTARTSAESFERRSSMSLVHIIQCAARVRVLGVRDESAQRDAADLRHVPPRRRAAQRCVRSLIGPHEGADANASASQPHHHHARGGHMSFCGRESQGEESRQPRAGFWKPLFFSVAKVWR